MGYDPKGGVRHNRKEKGEWVVLLDRAAPTNRSLLEGGKQPSSEPNCGVRFARVVDNSTPNA